MNWRKQLQLLTWRMRGMPVGNYLREYQAFAQLEPTVCQPYQQQLLRQILLYAKQHVPHYQSRLPDQNEIAATDPIQLLSSLPILTKAVLAASYTDLLSSEQHQRRTYTNSSGGSTGEPASFTQDQTFALRGSASVIFFEELIGQQIGDSRVLLWGSERDLLTGSMGWKAKLGQWLSRTYWMNAFRMSPELMREYIQKLNQLRPKLILAYAQAMYELAKFAEQEQLTVKPVTAIITSAGSLYGFMREKIEQVFHCPGRVFNRYGSREVGLIAQEVPQAEGLMVNFPSNYIEIVNDLNEPVPAGTEGKILVTNLQNYSMPFLRYEIGDRGVLMNSQAVTKGTQALIALTGRNVDVFRTRAGRVIGGEYFTHMLKGYLWLKQFQIIQQSYDQVHFRLVCNAAIPNSDWDEICHITRVVLGEQLQISRQEVAQIEPTASGKYRYTICEIPT